MTFAITADHLQRFEATNWMIPMVLMEECRMNALWSAMTVDTSPSATVIFTATGYVDANTTIKSEPPINVSRHEITV